MVPLSTVPQAKFLASVYTVADDAMSSKKQSAPEAFRVGHYHCFHLRQPAWVEAAFRDLPARRSRSSGYIKRAVTRMSHVSPPKAGATYLIVRRFLARFEEYPNACTGVRALAPRDRRLRCA